jgi:hypothetical protein
MNCRKQRTCHLLSTRQNLRSNTSFKMTYVRDTSLALYFCTGSNHPELPRMIRANSDFQYWASPDDLASHRMIWTGLTGLAQSSAEVLWSWGKCLLKNIYKWALTFGTNLGTFKVAVSNSSTISIFVNYLCALTKFVNKPPHILYRIKCLLAKIFKILGTD